MIQISSDGLAKTCQGVTRRTLLQVGAAAGPLAMLPQFGGRAAAATEAGKSYIRDKSIVFLFLQGGPSQIETFDPKMEAPAEIHSINGEIPTALPGVTFGSLFPKLAERAQRLAVVRSFASGNGDHQNYLSVLGGGSKLKAPMSSVYSRVAGTHHPVSGFPRNIIVTPEGTGTGAKMGTNFETQSLQKVLATGQAIGASYAAFDPSGGGELRQSLELRIERERFDDRRRLLAQIDQFRHQLDRTSDLDAVTTYEKQACDVILKGISEAFDLTKEDPRTLAQYDTTKLFRLEDVHRWGDMRRSSNLLGHQMLMARRLCEAGCGYVTVFDAGWDMHSNGNSPRNMRGLEWLGTQVDHAVAAFLDDVRGRGLSDKILLVISGEMGRTPKINKNGGRDHWGNLTPLVFAGGGLKMGQVIGQSDVQAGNPASEKYGPPNLMASLMRFAFDGGEVRLAQDLPRDVVAAVTEGKPISELF